MDQTIVLPPEIDHLKVACWCHREAAEVRDSPGGMTQLAICYSEGSGFQKDREQAAACLGGRLTPVWPGVDGVFGCSATYDEPLLNMLQISTCVTTARYQKAADSGEAACKAHLGALDVFGNASAGVLVDTARRVELLCQAARQGYVKALLLLAQCYLNGVGVSQARAALFRFSAQRERLLFICGIPIR